MHEFKKIERSFKKYISLFPVKGNEILKISQDLSDELKIFFMKAITQMPATDVISVNIMDVLKHVEHIHKIIKTIDYCKEIPIDIIFDYVLPYRINDEDFSLYSINFYNELKPLIKLDNIVESVLITNYWCYSKATYVGADARTQNAITTVKAGKGRCGEESVLLVSALRSIGIPARQCYSPYWTHCDDNHAWVEVYTGHKWEFLGACEPEERLNLGWFNNAASRALITRHRVFGLNKERINIDQNNIFTTITSTDMYVKTRTVTVNVYNKDKKRPYAKIGLYTVNYCTPRLIHEKTADCNGTVQFEIGQGDALFVASYNKKFNIALCSEETSEINLDISKYAKSIDFNLIPYEGDIQKDDMEYSKEHTDKLISLQYERENRHTDNLNLLKSRISNDYKEKSKAQEFNKYIELARLNGDAIEKFINDTSILHERKIEILETLTKKDFCDIKYEALCDMEPAYEYKDSFYNTGKMKNYKDYSGLCNEDFNKYLLSLRVENEPLYPHRKFIKQYFKGKESIEDILEFIDGLTILDEYSYPALVADIKGVIENKIVTSYSIPIHLVQISRALGIPAKLDPITREPKYFDGEYFKSFYKDDKKLCSINFINKTKQTFNCGTDFTICQINNGYFDYLDFDSNSPCSPSFAHAEMGLYAVAQASRQIDGSVTGRIDFLPFRNTISETISLQEPINLTKNKLKSIDVPNEILAISKGKRENCIHSMVLAYIQNNSEPTEHFLNELLENEEKIINSDIEIILFGKDNEKNDTLLSVLNKNLAKYNVAEFNSSWKQFRKHMHIGDLRLPFITAINDDKGLYSFANYNVGTVDMILKIFACCK